MLSRMILAAALAALSAPAALAADPAPGVRSGFIDAPLRIHTGPGAMTWTEVRRHVHEGNPTTRLVASEIAVATAETVDADRYPNPDLAVALEEGGIGGPLYKPSVAKVSIAQTILTGGKRTRALAAARRGVQVAEAALDAQEAGAVAEVARAYVDVLRHKYLQGLAERALEVASWDRELTGMRIRGGDLGDGAMHRMDLAVALAEARVERTGGALSEALMALPLAWNGEPGEVRDLAGVLPLPALPPDLEDLLDAAAQAPVVGLAARRIDRAEAEGDIARAARAPDVTVEAGYITTNGLGEHGWLLGVSLPLPTFDRNQGDIARAAAQLRRSRLERRSVLAEVRGKVLRFHARLTSLHREWTRLQGSVLPASRQVWRTVHDAFAGGELTLLDVAASGTELLALQEREIALRVEHALTRVALDEALGRIPEFLDAEVTP
ncbi:MAG: TolC family protein [Pseudomonadota bacterium]